MLVLGGGASRLEFNLSPGTKKQEPKLPENISGNFGSREGGRGCIQSPGLEFNPCPGTKNPDSQKTFLLIFVPGRGEVEFNLLGVEFNPSPEPRSKITGKPFFGNLGSVGHT